MAINPNRRLALCIGANYYDQLNSLHYAVPDARLVAEKLRSTEIGAFDAVDLVIDEDLDADGKPQKPVTRARIEAALKNLFKQSNSGSQDSTLFIYFAGHAMMDGNRNLVWLEPDHWQTGHYPTGQALSPIRGLRASDAEQFCRWLNEQQTTTFRYRLPTPDEARTPPATTKGLGGWCEQNYSYNLVGLTVEEEQEIRQALQTLPAPHLPLPSDRALALALALALDLDLDLARARARALALGEVVALIEKNKLSDAHRQLLKLQKHQNLKVARRASLMLPLVEAAQAAEAKNVAEYQKAYWRFIALTAQYAYEGYSTLEQERGQPGSYEEEKEVMAGLYWWTRIVELREEGKLPTWEGLRLARERIKTEEEA